MLKYDIVLNALNPSTTPTLPCRVISGFYLTISGCDVRFYSMSKIFPQWNGRGGEKRKIVKWQN